MKLVYARRLVAFVNVKGYREWLRVRHIEAYLNLLACKHACWELTGEEK